MKHVTIDRYLLLIVLRKNKNFLVIDKN